MPQVTKPASKEQWEEFLGVTDLTSKQVFRLNYDHLVSQGRVDDNLNQTEPLHLMLRSSTNPELPPVYTGYTLAPLHAKFATLEVAVPKNLHYRPKGQSTLTAKADKTKVDVEEAQSDDKRQEPSTTKKDKTKKDADNVRHDNKKENSPTVKARETKPENTKLQDIPEERDKTVDSEKPEHLHYNSEQHGSDQKERKRFLTTMLTNFAASSNVGPLENSRKESERGAPSK